MHIEYQYHAIMNSFKRKDNFDTDLYEVFWRNKRQNTCIDHKMQNSININSTSDTHNLHEPIKSLDQPILTNQIDAVPVPIHIGNEMNIDTIYMDIDDNESIKSEEFSVEEIQRFVKLEPNDIEHPDNKTDAFQEGTNYWKNQSNYSNTLDTFKDYVHVTVKQEDKSTLVRYIETDLSVHIDVSNTTLKNADKSEEGITSTSVTLAQSTCDGKLNIQSTENLTTPVPVAESSGYQNTTNFIKDLLMQSDENLDHQIVKATQNLEYLTNQNYPGLATVVPTNQNSSGPVPVLVVPINQNYPGSVPVVPTNQNPPGPVPVVPTNHNYPGPVPVVPTNQNPCGPVPVDLIMVLRKDSSNIDIHQTTNPSAVPISMIKVVRNDNHTSLEVVEEVNEQTDDWVSNTTSGNSELENIEFGNKDEFEGIMTCSLSKDSKESKNTDGICGQHSKQAVTDGHEKGTKTLNYEKVDNKNAVTSGRIPKWMSGSNNVKAIFVKKPNQTQYEVQYNRKTQTPSVCLDHTSFCQKSKILETVRPTFSMSKDSIASKAREGNSKPIKIIPHTCNKRVSVDKMRTFCISKDKIIHKAREGMTCTDSFNPIKINTHGYCPKHPCKLVDKKVGNSTIKLKTCKGITTTKYEPISFAGRKSTLSKKFEPKMELIAVLHHEWRDGQEILKKVEKKTGVTQFKTGANNVKYKAIFVKKPNQTQFEVKYEMESLNNGQETETENLNEKS